MNCLAPKTNKLRKLNFRNKSSVLNGYFPGMSKFIE